LKRDESSTAFLDTTFLLPLFQLNIDVKAFSPEGFRKFLAGLTEIHFSELSIFEAKAKLFTLSRKNHAYNPAMLNFGDNLAVLRKDERVVFHPYTGRDDTHLNLISAKALKLDCFDAIIVTQALDSALLITEDRDILDLREEKAFREDPILGKLTIRQWKELGY